MPNINSRTKKVALIIDIPKGKTIDESEVMLKEFINKYCANWFYILHDKDKDVNSGELKTPHFHLLFQSNDDKMHRLLWYIARCGECFKTDNLSLFTAEIWKNYESMIQYLIHKNDSDKFQYESSQINCYDENELQNVLKLKVIPSITIDRIIQSCKDHTTLTAVYFDLGLGVSQMYRGLIRDIFEDYQKRRFR